MEIHPKYFPNEFPETDVIHCSANPLTTQE